MSANGDLRHLTVLFDQLAEVVEPAALLRCLNLAAEHYLTVAPASALALADALVAGADWVDEPAFGALGRLGRGDALRRLGRLREAVAALDDAGRAFRALSPPDEVGWARTRIGWVAARQALGEWREVPAVVAEAMAVFTRHGETLRAVKLATNVGASHFERAEYAAALARDEEALALCGQLDPARVDVQLLQARIRSNRALVLAETGRFDAALAELEAARALFAAHGQTDSALAQALNIAYVRRGMGDYAAALWQLDDVVRAAQLAAATAREASARHEQALVFLQLGDCGAALRQADRAYRLYGSLERESDLASAVLILCAEIHATQGDRDEAFELLDVAEALAAREVADGAPTEQAGLAAAIALARAELHLADADHAAALSDAAQAGANFATLGRGYDVARAGLLGARAQLGLGRPAEAAEQAALTLAAATASAAEPLVAESHHVLASAARASGDLPGARRHLAAAIAALESLAGRLTPNLRSSFRASQQVFRDAIDLHLAAGDGAAAFDLLERAKSPALLASLAGALQRQPAEGLARDLASADLARRHHYQYAQLQQLVAAPRGPAAEVKIAHLRAELRELEAQLTEQLLRRERLRPAGAVFVDDADRAAALGSRLPPDAVLVEYYLAPTQGAVFVLTRDQDLARHSLDLDERRAEDLVNAWHEALTDLQPRRGHPEDERRIGAAEAELRGLSRALYDALVAPVAGQLAGCRHLIVVPYGALHALPFAALHDGERYLGERCEISTAVSAAVLGRCWDRRPAADGGRVVLGQDWQGRLPGCHAEALAVAHILGCPALVGEAATLGAVDAAGSAPCTLLHLAAHGEARLDNPLFAHLALADGQLTALAAAGLRLDGALVTLSACETGRGALVGGDELVGLSWAFLSAGAAAVVQSLWRIDDEHTVSLMRHFYRALADGRSVAAALRAAQRACRAEPGASIADWAAVQVVGDGAWTLPTPVRPGGREIEPGSPELDPREDGGGNA